MLVVIFFVFAKGLSSEMPGFIANFLITVVLFRGDKGKALSAFLTALPKYLQHYMVFMSLQLIRL